jgi:hypothetical protein
MMQDTANPPPPPSNVAIIQGPSIDIDAAIQLAVEHETATQSPTTGRMISAYEREQLLTEQHLAALIEDYDIVHTQMDDPPSPPAESDTAKESDKANESEDHDTVHTQMNDPPSPAKESDKANGSDPLSSPLARIERSELAEALTHKPRLLKPRPLWTIGE